MGSIFSRIVLHKSPGVIVAEDKHWFVLMDAYPMLPGHVLVIPRQEVARINELDDELAQGLFMQAREMSRALHQAGFSDGDSNILLNDGKHSGQTVPHVHIHVVPRKHGDAFPFPALLTSAFRKIARLKVTMHTLESQAEQIRSYIPPSHCAGTRVT